MNKFYRSEKEKDSKFDKSKINEFSYKINISQTEPKLKYQKERNIPKDIDINQYKQKDEFITSKSFKKKEE